MTKLIALMLVAGPVWAVSPSGAAQTPVGVAAQAAPARTIGPEDIMGLTDAHDAEISPDGRRVLYVTQPTISTQRPSRSSIWVVDADGRSPARRLTVSTGLDRAPQWSPDGKRIAFLSNRPDPNARGVLGFDFRPASQDPEQPGRGEAAPRDPSAPAGPSNQIWLMNADGGEASPLTGFTRDIRTFRWSGDGRRIAFLAPDPLTAKARADRAAKRDGIEVDGDRDLTRLWILDLDSRALRRIALADRDITDVSWSPDDRRLAVRAAASPGLNDYFYHSDLIVLDAATGAAERTVMTGVYSTASWSPDGRRIAFTAAGTDTIGIRGFVADVASGAPREIGTRLDGTIKRLEWARSGRLIARVLVHTRDALYDVDAASDRFRPLLGFDGAIKDFSIAYDGTLALAGTTPTSAADVWLFRRGALRLLTDTNPQIAGWRLGKVEEVRWTSSRDKRPIYGVLVTPPGYRPRTPIKTVVEGHGGPEGNWTAGWLGSWETWAQLLASNGYAVLLPNPRGSDGQGTDFARAVKQGWGDDDYQDDLDGVAMLVARGITDPARVGIGGWSYGGFMSAWAITHGDRFRTAIVGAAPTDILDMALSTDTPDFVTAYFGMPRDGLAKMDASSSMRVADRAHGPVLVLHGQEDRRVPVTLGLGFYRGLRLAGKEAQMVSYPREPHWLFEYEHQLDVQRRVLAWYNAHL